MRLLPRSLLRILLALILLPACHKDAPGTVYVDRVFVSEVDLASHPELAGTSGQLKAQVLDALQATGKIRVLPEGRSAPDGKDAWVADLDLESVRESPGPLGEPGGPPEGAVAEVEVQLELAHVGGERMRAGGIGERPFATGDAGERGDAFGTALHDAVNGAARSLRMQIDAGQKTDQELLSAVRNGDPSQRDVAIRVLADRRSPAAVPALVEQLDSPDREMALRAVGALVSIGDRRAVPALIDATTQKDGSFVAQVAYALGDLGGPDAEAYLFTASTGHPDPLVQRAATEALTTLRSHAQVKATQRSSR